MRSTNLPTTSDPHLLPDAQPIQLPTHVSPTDDVTSQRIDFAMNVGNVAWWEMDIATGAVRFHRHKTDMLGYDSENFKHYSDFTSILHPDDYEPAMTAMRDHFSGKEAEYKVDYRILHKNGQYRWFQDIGKISKRDQNGTPLTVTGIVFDITERKQTEKTLFETKNQLKEVLENSIDASYKRNLLTNTFEYLSPVIEHISGYSADEISAKSIDQILDLIHKADIEKVYQAYTQAIEDSLRRPHHVNFRFKDKQGEFRCIHDQFIVMRDEVGQPNAIIGSVSEITDRMHIESALHESETRLRRAENFALFGHWQFSFHDNLVRASDGARKIYGFDENDLSLAMVQNCVLSEYRPLLDLSLVNLIQNNIPYDVEFKIKRASDGNIVDVHSKAEFDFETNVVFGVVQDITARKKIESEREMLILELQNAIEQIKTLKGIVPICCSCKKIRDDKGYWEQVEEYVTRHTHAQFSHGLCPDCLTKLYENENEATGT